jgi:hypothetical protein
MLQFLEWRMFLIGEPVSTSPEHAPSGVAFWSRRRALDQDRARLSPFLTCHDHFITE